MTPRLAIVLALACMCLGATRYYSCGPRRMAASAAGAAPPASVTNCIAYYALDSNYIDSISGVTGAAVGASACFTNVSKSGGFSSFHNGYNYVWKAGKKYSLTDAPGYTISAWIFLFSYSTSPLACLFFEQGDGTYLSGLCMITSATNGGGGAQLKRLNFCLVNDPSPTVGATDVPTGTWVHCVSTWNVSDGAAKIYLNGVLDRTDTRYSGRQDVMNAVNGTFYCNGYGTYIGGNATLNGLVDEVRVYNRALTSNEVYQISQGNP